MKKLTKSRKNKSIAGVCGGFSKYLDIDVTLIRVLWGLSLLVGGLGLIAYIIFALVLPFDDGE